MSFKAETVETSTDLCYAEYWAVDQNCLQCRLYMMGGEDNWFSEDLQRVEDRINELYRLLPLISSAVSK
jgi:hypothetical protein